MRILKKHTTHFTAHFGYEPKVINYIKGIPGAKWVQSSKIWMIPAVQSEAIEVLTTRFHFQVTLAQNFMEDVPEPPPMPTMHTEPDTKLPLRGYQKEGVAYIMKHKKVLIGDEMGLGKTAQAITAVHMMNAFPCLVICPASLKINWEREFFKFTGRHARILTEGIQYYFDRYQEHEMGIDAVITNYEALRKYFVHEINKKPGSRVTLKDIIFNEFKDKFKSVIIDESHRTKNPSTLQSKLCKGITYGKETILLLSGTPVMNRPKELIPQLAILDNLHHFGGFQVFMNRFCDYGQGASNLSVLNKLLRTHCFYRREKSQVLKDLPAKVRQVITVDLPEQFRPEYETALEDLETYLKKYKEASDEKIQKSMAGEVIVRLGILKQITGRAKIQPMIENIITEVLDQGQKLVVFAHHHECITPLSEHFGELCEVLTGKQNERQKQQAVDRFQTDDSCRLIICSLQAGSLGITLTESSRVAFLELPWTAAATDQAEDRCHRIGQKDSVHAYYLLCRNTIDTHIYYLIDQKRDIHNKIVGVQDEVPVNFVDDFMQIFEQKEDPDVESSTLAEFAGGVQVVDSSWKHYKEDTQQTTLDL